VIGRVASTPPHDGLCSPTDKWARVRNGRYGWLRVAGFAQCGHCFCADQGSSAGEQWRELRKSALRKGYLNRRLSRTSSDWQIGIVHCRVE
jgi:hypothetical protein